MSQSSLMGLVEKDERSERARRAVKTFRSMQPSLTGYARALTGRKDVVVELATGAPRTDGTKIFFRPPMGLGDNTPHQRSVCDRRDAETMEQLCPACALREEVLVNVIHEISHIAFGTFEAPTDQAFKDAMERAIDETPGPYAVKIREAWDKVPYYKRSSYLSLSSLISPFLPILVNALEDARVDESMFKARKGTRKMFDASLIKTFRDGVEDDEGNYWQWRDKPLNSQALIGVFVLACGYNFKGWFSPEIEEALGDSRLQLLCSQVSTIRSAEGTYNLAFPILARLRELGFCRSEQDPEVPEEQPTEEETEDTDADDSSQEPDPSEDEDSGEDESGADGTDSDESVGDGGTDLRDDEPESEQPDSESSSGAAGGEDSDSDPEATGDSEENEGASGDSDVADEPDREDLGEGSGEREDGEPGESGEDGDGEESSDDGSSPERDDQASDAAGGSPDSSDDVRLDDDESGAEEGDSSDAGGDRPGAGRESDASESDVESSDASGLDDLAAQKDALQELIDTGADEGEGGEKLDSNPVYGDAEQAYEDILVFSKHDLIHGHGEEETPEELADDKKVDLAIMQGLYFESPSNNVAGVREHLYADRANDSHADGWNDYDDPYYKSRGKFLGGVMDQEGLLVGEEYLGPALIQMRRAFADNKRASFEKHRKSGRINSKVLGKRAPFGDERLFQKKRLPGKRDYAVLLGLDISGSTIGLNLTLIKRAAYAQAELCNRMGVDFAIYAHSGNGGWSGDDLYLDIYQIKSFDDPWNPTTQEALSHLCSDSQNLDGHTIEYYRKVMDRQTATDKVIMYYTDGKMPAENHDEELEILQREIRVCQQKRIALMGVGIRTDSPVRHGLDTVQVDDDSDLVKVIRHLESALLRHR
jgi:hypothetical protein